MAPRKTRSKYDCDISLFQPEPPVAERLVKSLFAGRDAELQKGYKILLRHLDISGSRSKGFDKKPWVIHGESRSGKSHLARRILAEFKAKPQRIKMLIPAREKIEALLVMADLFGQLVGEFRRLTSDDRLSPPVKDLPDIRLVDDLIEQMRLFLDTAQSATITRERSDEATLEVGGELSGLLGKLLGKYQSRDANKQTRQVVLKPPTPERLAEVCGVIVEKLMQYKLAEHLLVLVDDVDLLDYSAASPQQARVQRSLLTDALCTLHGQPGVDVVLTARSWFVYSGKVLTQLVDLTQSVLSPEALVEIHNNHIRQFATKAGVERFLTPEGLQEFANEMQELNGLPGVFLQHLHTAFDRYKDDSDFTERDYEWFVDVFRKLVAALRSRCELAVSMIEEATRNGQLHMRVTEGNNPFIGTAFDNLLVFQSYHDERCYFTSPLVRRIFTNPRTVSGPGDGL